jgi:hypothetical protein
MKKLQDYLNEEGGENFLFNCAMYNLFSIESDREYAAICGNFREGVFTWADHSIDTVEDVANAKYQGWVLHLSGGSVRKAYIPNWVLNLNVSNYKHAKCLFNKYIKRVE